MKKTKVFWIARESIVGRGTAIYLVKPEFKARQYWGRGTYWTAWGHEWPKLRPGECVKVRMEVVG